MPVLKEAPVVAAARSGLTIGIAQLAGYLLSFALGVAIAAFFGTGGATDAYFMASSTAELVAKLLLGGALTSVLLPVFVKLLSDQQPERAWSLFLALFSLALVVFILLGGAIEVFAAPLMDFLAPGFTGEARALTVTLIRIVLPAYLVAFLADLAIVPLHAHRRFGLPAVSRLVIPLTTLLVLLALVRRIGVVTLAVGTLGGTVLQVLVLMSALRRTGFRFRLHWPQHNPDVRHLLLLTAPFALSILAAHGAGIVYRILVSQEPAGSLASLKFAEKIFQMTNVLFLGSIAQVAFPAFARAAAASAAGEILARLRAAIRAVAFLGVPLTVGIVLLREPVVRLLYERGAFTPEATAATAVLVPLFVVGLLGNGISSLFGHLALALQETRLIIGVNVALQAIAAALFVLSAPRFGVLGLAAVSGLGPFLLTALYAWALRRRLPHLRALVLDPVYLHLALAGVVCIIVVLAAQRIAANLPGGPLRDLAALLLGGVFGLTGYVGAARLLGVTEVSIAWTAVRQFGRRLLPRS